MEKSPDRLSHLEAGHEKLLGRTEWKKEFKLFLHQHRHAVRRDRARKSRLAAIQNDNRRDVKEIEMGESLVVAEDEQDISREYMADYLESLWRQFLEVCFWY